jgi:hypothetical protein
MFVLFRLLRVLKWGLLFDKRRGLTTTGHSHSTGEWLCCPSFSLTHSPPRLNSHPLLTPIKSQSQSQGYATTYGQSASLSWCQAPSEAQDQIFVTVTQLRVSKCGSLSLTTEWVCRLQLLLVLSSAVILGSKSRETYDILLSVSSELLYDWRFTPNHFVLAPSNLRITTWDFFFCNWTLAIIVLM